MTTPPIWDSKIDGGKYTYTVTRTEGYKGHLVLKRADGSVLAEREVTLSYDARAGCDVSDVEDWDTWVLAKVDAESA